MKQPDMEKLIAEELLGKALNDEERRQLEDWLNADPANREQYARICAGVSPPHAMIPTGSSMPTKPSGDS